MRRRAFLATLALALAFTLPAEQDQPYKLSVRSNLVFLPTRVQTKHGDTIHGLRPEQFVVEDNGCLLYTSDAADE